MNRILLTEALKIIENSNRDGKITPFSIGVITWDEKQSKGGKKLILKHSCKFKEEISHVPGTGTGSSKNPFHWENQTINLLDLDQEARHPVKIHVRLIYMFNDKFIYW